MTALGARRAALSGPRTGALGAAAASVLRGAGTILGVLALALLLLLQPAYMHPALDAAGSASLLGTTAEETHRLSDLAIGELVFGGDFAFSGPDGARFLDGAEASHMRDARTALYAFLGVSAVVVAGAVASVARARRRADPWRHVARGAAALVVGVTVAGLVALIAFDTAFELFHRVVFPGGNWAFDPSNQRLVRLYPLPFWQLTAAALGVVAVVAAAVVWWAASRRARSLEAGR